MVAAGCIKPDKNSTIEKGGTHKVPPLAKMLLAIDGFWRERISFFKNMTPERLAMSRWPYTIYILGVPSGFSGGNQTKQKMNLGENFGGGTGEELEWSDWVVLLF